MREPITNKAQMYRLLSSGQLGNTIPQFFGIESWLASPDSQRYEWWGVRSAVHSMHPACKLHCHRDEVASYARQHFGDGPNISMMVDRIATVLGFLEVWDGDQGLIVEGVLNPDVANGWTWRNSMRDPSRRRSWHGMAARMLLRQLLNENSFDDLEELLRLYPNHVIEMSALDRCLGVVPHRNAITWEARCY